jgi:ankyrin repeat protein
VYVCLSCVYMCTCVRVGITVDTLLSSAGRGDLLTMVDSVEFGIDINAKHSDTHMTALMHAARGGHFKCTVYLLGRGADLARGDKQGKQAIHYACEAGQTSLIAELVKWSVDLQSRDQ